MLEFNYYFGGRITIKYEQIESFREFFTSELNYVVIITIDGKEYKVNNSYDEVKKLIVEKMRYNNTNLFDNCD